MIEHRPKHKTDVKIGDKVYKADSKGRVFLPERFKQFNPVEEEEIVIKPKKKKKKED